MEKRTNGSRCAAAVKVVSSRRWRRERKKGISQTRMTYFLGAVKRERFDHPSAAAAPISAYTFGVLFLFLFLFLKSILQAFSI